MTENENKINTTHLKNVFDSFFSLRLPLTPKGESTLHCAESGSPFRESEGSEGGKNIFEMGSGNKNCN